LQQAGSVFSESLIENRKVLSLDLKADNLQWSRRQNQQQAAVLV